MKYWLGKNGQQLGPYEIAELQNMAAAGELNAADLVWTQGMAAWTPVFEVIRPQSSAPPAPAPAPPPPARQEPAATMPVIQAFGQPQPYQPSSQPAPQPTAQYGQPQQYDQPQYNQPQYGQPQQQYAPQQQQPQYAPQPAAPMNPGMAAPMAVGGPVPPAMHWALVWLIGAVTFGIFFLVWILKEATFVQSIDPRSKAKMLYLAGIGLEVVYVVLAIAGAVLQNSLTPILLGVGGLMALAAVVCLIIAHFDMRSSLVRYYNSVENIGLKLSGVMTFFFNILYFQHHFTRIADWKRTGLLRPQK